jgi:hypothetical protein
MSEYCVVVVDHAKADIFRLAGPRSALQKLTTLDNPAGHGHERDLGTAPPGRVSTAGARRHTFEGKHTLRQHATESFVRAISSEVGKRVSGKAGDVQIVVVAAAPLQGLLRRFLPRSTRCPVVELRRNLGKLPQASLAREVRSFVGALQRQMPVGERA